MLCQGGEVPRELLVPDHSGAGAALGRNNGCWLTFHSHNSECFLFCFVFYQKNTIWLWVYFLSLPSHRRVKPSCQERQGSLGRVDKGGSNAACALPWPSYTVWGGPACPHLLQEGNLFLCAKAVGFPSS